MEVVFCIWGGITKEDNRGDRDDARNRCTHCCRCFADSTTGVIASVRKTAGGDDRKAWGDNSTSVPDGLLALLHTYLHRGGYPYQSLREILHLAKKGVNNDRVGQGTDPPDSRHDSN